MMVPPTRKRARYSGEFTPGDPMQLVAMSGESYPRTRGRALSTRSSSSRYYRSRRSGPYYSLGRNVGHVDPVYPPPEIKTVDNGADGAVPATPPVAVVIPSAGATVFLNDIANGTGGNARVGISAVIRSCSYRFEVKLPAVTAPDLVPCSGRVMLVWDRQPNGQASPAAFSDIFEDQTYLSFLNINNNQRFVILRNQQFSLSPNGNEILFFEGFCKINMKTTFLANQLPTTGALLLVYICDQTNVASRPSISGSWRVRYVDV